MAMGFGIPAGPTGAAEGSDGTQSTGAGTDGDSVVIDGQTATVPTGASSDDSGDDVVGQRQK